MNTHSRPIHTQPTLEEAQHGLLANLQPTLAAPLRGIDSRVLRLSLASRALGVRKTLYVYLPPEYESTAQRFPVLYLLRGHEREWVNPHEDRTRRGTAVDVYLRLRASNMIGPMILVFPGVTSADGSIHGLATDFLSRDLVPDAPGIGSGRFESYLVDDVVPAIDELFRTRPDRRHRGVDGFSLGGFMAVKLAAQHPQLFASAGAYDGTFLYANRSGTRVRTDDHVFKAPIFDPAFGRPRNQSYAAANSPANLIIQGAAAQLRQIRWHIRYGPESGEPMDSNYYRGAYLRGLLEARGIDGTIDPVMPDGRHNWATADRHLAATLPLHCKALQ